MNGLTGPLAPGAGAGAAGAPRADRGGSGGSGGDGFGRAIDEAGADSRRDRNAARAETKTQRSADGAAAKDAARQAAAGDDAAFDALADAAGEADPAQRPSVAGEKISADTSQAEGPERDANTAADGRDAKKENKDAGNRSGGAEALRLLLGVADARREALETRVAAEAENRADRDWKALAEIGGGERALPGEAAIAGEATETSGEGRILLDWSALTSTATAAKFEPGTAARIVASGLLSVARPLDADADRTAPAGDGETADAGTMPSDGDDGLFRFARATEVVDEQRVTSLSLDKGGPDDGAMALDREKVDLSILDSRKFLGVAVGQTAAVAVVSAVTENPEWNAMLREAAAISATTLDAAKNASNSLKIQLSPVELGVVTATLRLAGGNLSIELKVETIEAYRQLSDDQSSILKALKGHGYDVEQITIQHVAVDRSAPVQTENQTSGSTANPSTGQGADGRAEGRPTGSGQRDGSSGERAAAERLAAEAGDNGASAPHRSGDVYL